MVMLKSIEDILVDLTGEPRPEVAFYLGLKDILEHRLEKISQAISELEKKYRMNFKKFKENWSKGKIAEKYSYPVEKDYWEWEALMARKTKLERLSRWLR